MGRQPTGISPHPGLAIADLTNINFISFIHNNTETPKHLLLWFTSWFWFWVIHFDLYIYFL